MHIKESKSLNDSRFADSELDPAGETPKKKKKKKSSEKALALQRLQGQILSPKHTDHFHRHDSGSSTPGQKHRNSEPAEPPVSSLSDCFGVF